MMWILEKFGERRPQQQDAEIADVTWYNEKETDTMVYVDPERLDLIRWKQTPDERLFTSATTCNALIRVAGS